MWLITRHADTVDGLLVIASDAVGERSGWTTFVATAPRQVLNSVNTAAGAFTTVDTTKTSLSHATRPDQATIAFEHFKHSVQATITLKH